MSIFNQLCCNNVTVRRDKQLVLDTINFSLEPGCIIALGGRNGAGKTTLLEAIAGIIPIQSGSINFNNKPIHDLTSYQRQQQSIILVPDRGHVFQRLTVRENISIFSPHSEKTIAYLLECFPRFSTKLNQRAGTLSGGEKRILSIFSAIMYRPRLLLIDEFSEGLQINAVDKLLSLLLTASKEGVSCLIVVHSQTFAIENMLEIVLLENQRLTL